MCFRFVRFGVYAYLAAESVHLVREVAKTDEDGVQLNGYYLPPYHSVNGLSRLPSATW